MMKVKDYTANWFPADYILAALIVIFPSYNKLMPVLIVLLAVTLIRHRSGPNSFRAQFRLGSPYLWFLLFYFSHVLGLLNTEDFGFAGTDLSMKASFVLIPVLLTWTRWKMTIGQIIDLFLIGLVLACIIAFGKAGFKSIYHTEDNHWAYFTESYFSFSMHRSYFATYLAAGTLISVYRFFTQQKRLYIPVTFILGLSTVLTFSKAGIILLFVLLIPTLIILSVRYFSWLQGLVLAALAISSISVVFMLSPTVRVRFTKMFEGATSVPTINNPSVESSASRVIMWSTSWELFSENPILGVGTGDISNELDSRNFKLGNSGVAEKSLNSHNQYLNTGVQLGLMGLIPLLLIFITSLINAIRRRFAEGILLVTILFLTLLFESFLETQAGIIPVTILLLLFFHHPPIISTIAVKE